MAYNPFDQNWDSINPFKRPDVDNSEAEAAAAYQAMIDAKQKQAEDAINAVFDKFGQEDYDRVRGARRDFENIELKDQYNDALKELEFALARGGRKGSTNLKKRADAAKEWKKQQILSGQRAEKDARTYKGDIAKARQDMHQLNIANADPAMLAETASRRAGCNICRFILCLVDHPPGGFRHLHPTPNMSPPSPTCQNPF